LASQYITGVKLRSLDLKIIDEFVANLQEELNIHRLRSKWINIKFVKSVDGNMGDCIGDTSDVDIRINKTMDWKDQMITLAHEMVHAEQFLRGKLTDGAYWRNRNYEKCEYERLPWEMSAHQLEEKLYEKCYPEWAPMYPVGLPADFRKSGY
tara:strand:+ start:1744 stop:2199 length:456 start_codon:yes stop_codon:yes gene_type:complete